MTSPGLRMSNLTSALDGLKRPRNFKQPWQPVVSVSASVFQKESSTNHWVFPDFDIMKGSISLPKVIKISF